MMYSMKRSFAVLLALGIITTRCRNSITVKQQDTQSLQMISMSQPTNKPPYWEYMLREFVFRTISPPPLANNDLYKRILNAPLYSDSFPLPDKNDTNNIILSRGDIYYLPNGQWLLCQENCINCEPCSRQNLPIVKWVLKRLKRVSTYGLSRYDFQFTLLPQIDGSYHMKSLWPRSYIYVVPQGERLTYSTDPMEHVNAADAFLTREENSSKPYMKDFNFTQEPTSNSWKINITNFVLSSTNSPMPPDIGSRSEKKKSDSPQRIRNFTKLKPRIKPTERPVYVENSTILIEIENDEAQDSAKPQLILGTDQEGRKHLIHVVPAEQTPIDAITSRRQNASTSMSHPGVSANESVKSSQFNNKLEYHRILQRIFNSLVHHRRPIEQFLQSTSKKLVRKELENREDKAGIRLKRLNPTPLFDLKHNKFNKSRPVEKDFSPVIFNKPSQRKVSVGRSTRKATNTLRQIGRPTHNSSAEELATYTHFTLPIALQNIQIITQKSINATESSNSMSTADIK